MLHQTPFKTCYVDVWLPICKSSCSAKLIWRPLHKTPWVTLWFGTHVITWSNHIASVIHCSHPVALLPYIPSYHLIYLVQSQNVQMCMHLHLDQIQRLASTSTTLKGNRSSELFFAQNFWLTFKIKAQRWAYLDARGRLVRVISTDACT